MTMKQPFLRLGASLALLLSGVAAYAAVSGGSIAEVVDVVKDAYHAPPGGAETLAKIGDGLLPDETLRTAADSAIEISFPDGATLRLEADSDMVLDSYVFDPNAAKSAAAITVSDGVARFTTSGEDIDDTGITFTTPVATIGIRGTDIVISVNAQGATVIDVLDGQILAKANKHDQMAEAIGGQSVLIEKVDLPPEVGTIGDFATAAGPAPGAAPTDFGGNKLDRQKQGEAPSGGNQNGNQGGGSNGGDNSGGGSSGGGSSGGGSSGGGGSTGGGGQQSDSDGDGNSGHGNNGDKNDRDNPGKGGGKK